MTEQQSPSYVEIMQVFKQNLETLAICIAEALLPAFQELNKAVLEWYRWYIQRRRETMVNQLLDKNVPIVLAHWIASRWPEKWLPKLP